MKPFLNNTTIHTNLIYRLDNLNSTNFHKYIDSKFNLFVIVKLINGIIIGAYSYFPIEKDRSDKNN